MTGHRAVVPTNGDVKSTALHVFAVGSLAECRPNRQ